MRISKAKLITSLLFAAAFVGVITYLVARGQYGPVDFHVIGVAVSDSDTGGCRAVTGIANDIVNRQDPSRTLVIELYRSGDASTSNEPVSLGPPIRAEASIIASEAGGGKAIERLKKVLGTIRSQCASLPVTTVSPIYLMTRTLSENLRRNDCGTEPVNCFLWIASDGEETEEPGLVDAIRGAKKPRELPPKIQNGVIAINMCGFAQTIGKSQSTSGKTEWKTPLRDSARNTRLDTAWKQTFLNESRFHLMPFCTLTE